jgi:hypothetical protein
MTRDYYITVRWTKGSDVQLGTYELSGEMPRLFEEAYEKSIGEGKAIYDPERIDFSAIPRSALSSSATDSASPSR